MSWPLTKTRLNEQQLQQLRNLPLVEGQRFNSLSEPELGLGIIEKIDGKNIQLHFPDADETRWYAWRPNGPLYRILLNVGDQIQYFDDSGITVEEKVLAVGVEAGIICYQTASEFVPETWLKNVKEQVGPFEKIRKGQIENLKSFDLRQHALECQKNWNHSPVRGLVGGRIDLLPHQLYVAHQVTNAPRPRALLADEVGLGKTIEAGLILHQQVILQRVKKALIILPDSLVHQWFVEMFRKFQLSFRVVTKETPPAADENPFLENQFVILAASLLKGSKTAVDLLKKASWDMIIIDEVHKIDLSQDTPDANYIREWGAKVHGLLLLSATPLQGGSHLMFHWLKLLDPERFHDLETFRNDQERYGLYAQVAQSIAQSIGSSEDEVISEKLKTKQLAGYQLTKKELKDLSKFWQKESVERFEKICLTSPLLALDELKDRQGMGRVYFRNTRKRIGELYPLFKRRKLHSYEINFDRKKEVGEIDKLLIQKLKQKWFIDFCQKMIKKREAESLTTDASAGKILLLCRSREQVEDLEMQLMLTVPQLEVSVFHSGLGPLDRDKQVAKFLDPKGAQLLLCTEVGSEGRNFEFAQHLVLLDLPLGPDKLEQRIGRLDRIGQKNAIEIHVPVISGTGEEALLKWYDQALDIFTSPCAGADVLAEELDGVIEELLSETLSSAQIDKRIIASQKRRIELQEELESGRDYLVELNSFDQKIGESLRQLCLDACEDGQLIKFVDHVFEVFGVESEDHSATVQFVRPSDNMFVPSFPGLDPEGQSMTLYRDTARHRFECEFLTWDHPLVTGSMELILGHQFGLISAVQWRDSKVKKTLLECFYLMQLKLPQWLQAERYFSPQVIRVMVDLKGEDFAHRYTAQEMSEKITALSKDKVEHLAKLTEEHERILMGAAHRFASEKQLELRKQFRPLIEEKIQIETDRLKELSLLSGLSVKKDLEVLMLRKEMLLSTLEENELDLCGMRFIF